ncbi:MAG TPA: hypothetical protein VLT45_04530 [Kofleriaceae bacterium]|nr:hypothetical protein [Kofleriaceae bacterium]
MKCQAIVQDWANATRYNLSRQLRVAPSKPCSRNAVSKVGPLCLCRTHVRLALDGLIDEEGRVEDRSVLADVRHYPSKFPNGVHRWQLGLEAGPLPSETLPSDPCADREPARTIALLRGRSRLSKTS